MITTIEAVTTGHPASLSHASCLSSLLRCFIYLSLCPWVLIGDPKRHLTHLSSDGIIGDPVSIRIYDVLFFGW